MSLLFTPQLLKYWNKIGFGDTHFLFNVNFKFLEKNGESYAFEKKTMNDWKVAKSMEFYQHIHDCSGKDYENQNIQEICRNV